MERKNSTLRFIGIATACILIFLGVQNIDVIAGVALRLLRLIMPLILGLAFAVIINVPMHFFELKLWQKTKKPLLQKLRRVTAFIISLLLIIGILVGLSMLVIPEITKAVKLISRSAVQFLNELNEMDKSELRNLPFGNLLLDIDWNKMLSTAQNWLKTQGGNIMNTAFGTLTSFVGGIFDLFISFVFMIYMLFGKDTLKAQIKRLVKIWIPEKTGDFLIHTTKIASENFRNFISGQSLEAVILGSLCMVGMLLLRIPYAPTVGALVGVSALIPVVGGFIGAGVGAFMILTVSPIKALVFIIFLLILQQLEGNLIYPKVMGSRVNLPAIWILAAVTIGGGLGGALGMLLSVPIASTFYVLLKEATAERERKTAKKK